MTNEMTADSLQQLIERAAIEEVLTRYCRAVDRCDQALLESTYWEDGIDNHGDIDRPIKAFAAYIIDHLSRMRQTSHCLSNIRIHFSSSTEARVESYVTAHHEWGTGEAAIENTAGGRYLDIVTKRGPEWRLMRRQVVVDWQQERPSASQEARWRRAGSLGGRFPEDPSYSHLMTSS